MKRAEKRTNGKTTYVPSNKFGLDSSTVVGYIKNQYSEWSLHKLTSYEKELLNLDDNCYRTYSERTETTNIMKINLGSGTYAFINEDTETFQKMTPYRLVISD